MPQTRFTHCARFFFVLGAAALLTIPCADRVKARAALYVTGRVLDQSSHETIAGAVVSLYAPGGAQSGAENATPPLSTAQSLQNGAYILRAPSPGAYTVKIDAPDAASTQQQVVVTPAGLNLDLLLKRLPAVPIKLVREDGKPLLDDKIDATVWILAVGDGSENELSRPIRLEGLATIPLKSAVNKSAIRRLLIQVRSTRDGVGEVRAEKWPSQPLLITLKPGLTLEGKAVDTAGKPLPDSSIGLFSLLPDGWPSPGAQPLSTPTDATGAFSFPNLAPGSYLIHSELKGIGSRSRRVELPTQTPVVLTPADPEWSWSDEFRPNGGYAIGLANIMEALDPDQAKTLIAVRGRVVDRATQKPMPGAGVSLRPIPQYSQPMCSDTRTNADGSFALHAMSVGQYELAVDVPDYRVVSHSLDVPLKGLADQSFSLPRLLTARLKVLGPGGSPLKAGALHVYVMETHPRQNLSEDESPTLNPDGTVQVSSPRYGGQEDDTPEKATGVIFAARLETEGFGEVRLPAWPKTTDTVVVQLKPALTLSGKVLDQDGRPVEGSWIWASARATTGKAAEPSVGLNERTDSHGSFKFPQLPAGDYDISTQIPGAGYKTHFIHLTAAHHTVVIRASDAQSTGTDYGPGTIWVSGRVKDRRTGKPLDGVSVMISTRPAAGAPFNESSASGATSKDGTFRLPTTMAGPHQLVINDARYAPTQTSITVLKKGLSGIVLAASPLPALRLKLLNTAGQPLTVQLGNGILGSTSLNATAVLTWKGGSLSTGADAGDLHGGILSMNLPDGMPHAPITGLVVAIRDALGGCAQVRLPRWPDHPITVRLQPGSVLIGTVQDADGKPVDTPYVRIVRLLGVPGDQNWQSFDVLGGTDGSFAAPHLLPGVYELRVHIPGQDLRYHRITVAGAQTQVTLTPADSKSASSGFPD